MSTPVLHATTDLVAAAWIASIPGLSPAMVGPTLPKDTSKWSDDGFVQVSTVGGTPEMYLPVRNPVIAIDCWAVSPSSSKAPWGRASYLAELIVGATYDSATIERDLALPGGYPMARVLSAYPTSEPRRVYSDSAGYARFNFDLALTWIQP